VQLTGGRGAATRGGGNVESGLLVVRDDGRLSIVLSMALFVLSWR
jgi:hypothetical protein